MTLQGSNLLARLRVLKSRINLLFLLKVGFQNSFPSIYCYVEDKTNYTILYCVVIHNIGKIAIKSVLRHLTFWIS